jgi:hypothetical protein
VFTARYALSPYIKLIRFVFKGLKTELRNCGGALGVITALSGSQTRRRSEHDSWKDKSEAYVRDSHVTQAEY